MSMKILILLFVAATACGQTEVFRDSCGHWVPDPEYAKRYNLIQYIHLKYDSLRSIDRTCFTPEDLDSYLQDCYNDSTQIRIHESKNGEMCIMDWECLSPHHYKMVWIHREATLQGFSQWMKGRK